MFIQLIHGDGCILLLNPECQIQNILPYLKLRCGLDLENKIELLPIDENEISPLMYLRTPAEYLSPYVTNRVQYIPTYIQTDKKGAVVSIRPQVTEWEQKFPDLEARIREFLDKKKSKKKQKDADKQKFAATAETEEATETKKSSPTKKGKRRRSRK